LIIIPAIDLKEGRCVRLAQGDFGKATIYSDDPARVAQRWQEQGAERIHVVDLDGSLLGSPANMKSVEAIVRGVDIPIQLGGGIRDRKTIETYLDIGVQWIILGTVVLRDEVLVRESCRAYENRIVLGIDAGDDKVAVQGWTEKTAFSPIELARRYDGEGIAAIIYTDIKRDGMERGVNVEATKAMAQAVNIPVIASGGVAGLEDIEKLKGVEQYGVTGVIIGKALYTGALSLKEAIKAAAC
jgi:phosphoribosylformimino-5-aminoimidazole carboxamide ribotide isomerase